MVRIIACDITYTSWQVKDFGEEINEPHSRHSKAWQVLFMEVQKWI